MQGELLYLISELNIVFIEKPQIVCYNIIKQRKTVLNRLKY